MSTTTLYRAYDANNVLLYIGISSQIITRFDQHTQSSKWMAQCATITVEHYRTRNEALVAERKAIELEDPIFNEMYKVKR